MEFLRTEGEELRRREKTYMEACQHDSEMRIQSALAAYAQEIDSLKAVLELRNGELHDVRQRNLECKREVHCTNSLCFVYFGCQSVAVQSVAWKESSVMC